VPLELDVWDERLRDDPDGPALAANNRSQWHQFHARTARLCAQTVPPAKERYDR